MKYCPHCGAPLAESTKFCSKCGSPAAAPSAPPPTDPDIPFQPPHRVDRPPAPSVPVQKPDRRKEKRLLIILLIVFAALIILIVLLLLGLGSLTGKSSSRPYGQTVERFFSALEEKDGAALMDLLPHKIVDSTVQLYGSEDAALEALEAEVFDSYGDLRISYEITDAQHMDQEDIADLEEDYLSALDTSLDISNAYSLGIEVTLRAGSISVNDALRLDVIQCDGDWYLDIISLINT